MTESIPGMATRGWRILPVWPHKDGEDSLYGHMGMGSRYDHTGQAKPGLARLSQAWPGRTGEAQRGEVSMAESTLMVFQTTENKILKKITK